MKIYFPNIKNILKRISEKRSSVQSGGNPQTPGYWLQKLFGAGNATTSGVSVNEETALKFSAVWAAVNIISGAVGFLPMPVYKRVKGGKEPAFIHPVYKLLHDRPNKFMDAITFRETLQSHVLTWGNGYAEIERDGAMRPLALWPLSPARVEPVVVNSKLVYEVSRDDGPMVQLPYTNVLHIKGLGFDGLKGYSVIAMAANSIGYGLAAEESGARFFDNDSSPTGLLKHESPLDPKTIKTLKDSWEESHRGLDQSHRIAILHGGLTYEQVGIPQKDAQFIETRKFQISDIARWYQVPPHMLAELDKATFSNIEEQGINFVTWTLMRWLKKWESESNYKLFAADSRKRYFSEFVTAALLRGNTKSRFEAYRIAILDGWMSRNQVRALENMNPEDDLDEYFIPSNVRLASDPAAEPEPEPEPEPDEPEPESEPVPEKNTFRELWQSTWQRIVNKEVGSLRKALKKPDKFDEFMFDFYSKHKDYVAELIEPVVRGCLPGVDAKMRAIDIATEYVSDRVGLIEKSEDVAITLSNWQSSLPVIMTARMETQDA